MDISELNVRQIANALIIFGAAMPYGADAVKAALMTAADESSFLRYANDGSYALDTHEQIWQWYGKTYGGPGLTLDQSQVVYRDHMRTSLTYPYDAVAGSALTTKDSVGLFQQREMFGYGTIGDLMDPAESTRIFVRGSASGQTRYFLESPVTMTLAQRSQWVQGSEFPDGIAYAPMEVVADQLIAYFGGIPAPPEADWLDSVPPADLQATLAAVIS